MLVGDVNQRVERRVAVKLLTAIVAMRRQEGMDVGLNRSVSWRRRLLSILIAGAEVSRRHEELLRYVDRRRELEVERRVEALDVHAQIGILVSQSVDDRVGLAVELPTG